MNAKKGFTLTELVVAVLIVAILAVIAVSFTRMAIRKAIVAEALSALGHIKTAQSLYFVDRGEYMPLGFARILPDVKDRAGGVYGTGDLDGTYFSEECYQVFTHATGHWAYCRMSSTTPNRAPKVDKLREYGFPSFSYVMMRMEDGKFCQMYMPELGYPQWPPS